MSVRDIRGQFVGETPIKPIVNAVSTAYQSIRAKHPDVPNAMLVVGATAADRYGHFAPGTWTSKNAVHEIMMTGASLARGADDVMGTLLHESAHAMAFTRGLRDTSRQGRWHNKVFAQTAQEIGLLTAKSKQSGYHTHLPLTDVTKLEYKAELRELEKALVGFRVPEMRVISQRTFIELTCPSCERSLKVGPKFYEQGPLMCLPCHEEMIEGY